MVLSFDNQNALESAKSFYVEASAADNSISSWVFAKDNILLQLNGEIPEAEALAYGSILIKLE
jgi:hypothetical protein